LWLSYTLRPINLGAFNKAAAVPGLNREDAYSVEIPLPPLEEQKRIARILNEQMATLERARAAAEAQMEAAKALPAAYLRAIFNSPEAQRWVRKPLGKICQIVARQVDPKLPEYAALSHVSGENIEGGLCRLLHLNTAAQDAMTSGKYLFAAGDVLYSKLRPYLRKVVVVDFRGVCSADMYPIRVNRDVLDPHFTAWMLVSDEFTKYADEESRRARMPKLNRDQLFAWNAPIPPLREQQRIVARLSEQMAAAGKTRKALEEQLNAINALPAALLRRAFSGKL
jgi:type I restriction enzyme S subunit